MSFGGVTTGHAGNEQVSEEGRWPDYSDSYASPMEWLIAGEDYSGLNVLPYEVTHHLGLHDDETARWRNTLARKVRSEC